MRAFAFGFAALLALAIGKDSIAAGGASPIGRWWTEGGGSHIEIYRCGPHLCGRIVWLKEPHDKDGQVAVDSKNPDPAKRARTLMGLTIMWNFTASPDSDEWEGGRIYNPRDGDTYRGMMKLHPDGSLEVRGYIAVPVLGGSTHWKRVR